MKRRLLAICAITLLIPPVPAQELPFADVHLHYNWDQAEVTSPREAVNRLRANNVVLAVVSSTPSELVLSLREAGGNRVLPLFSPYRKPDDWLTWNRDESLPGRVREALESGLYFGIGEMHLIPGFARRWDTPVFREVMELAQRYDVPVQIHTEASVPGFFLEICQRYPEVRFLWAHAGGILQPQAVAQVMAGCPNVWTELSARDPWRYVAYPITAADGSLLPEWETLVRRYPDRFMTGADALWPVEQLHPWDEPDTGWQRLDQYIAFHRAWLGKLPPETAEKVRLRNALRFFRRTGAETEAEAER